MRRQTLPPPPRRPLLASTPRSATLSTMSANSFDATNHARITQLGTRVLNGELIEREDALWLFNLEDSADILDLLSWANRIREHFKGNKVHLCSIVNVK